MKENNNTTFIELNESRPPCKHNQSRPRNKNL